MEQASPPVARVPAATVTVGGYRVLGRLAVGGMSELFMAEEAIDGEALRYVVIKLLPAGGVGADAEQLFLREGRTLLRLDHPNICHSYAFGKVGARCYIAMEWIDGVSLRELLLAARDQGKALSYALAANMIAQVAAGLEHAHTARDAQRAPLHVVHRDVNPTNIMIRHDGVVKLIDFGVAQVAERRVRSEAEQVRGKLAYMAPEQVRGEPLDHRVDVFALGVCLYELLSGTRLYRRVSREATAYAVLEEPVPSARAALPAVPEALDAIVQRALQKDPAARFASAGELGAALEDYLVSAGEPMGARPLKSLMTALFPHHTGRPQLDVLPDLALRFSDPGPLPIPTSPVSELPPPDIMPDLGTGDMAEASESRARARTSAYDGASHSGIVTTTAPPPALAEPADPGAPAARRSLRVPVLSAVAVAALAAVGYMAVTSGGASTGELPAKSSAPALAPAPEAPVPPEAPSPPAADATQAAQGASPAAGANGGRLGGSADPGELAPTPTGADDGQSADPSADKKNRARRRRSSPGFIADPGF